MIWSLCISTLLASLLGSLHCAGMCGVFAALATCSPTTPSADRLKLFFAYSGGRWVSYATLGAISGIVGQVVDMGATSAGFTRIAGILAAIAVTLAGTSHLLQKAGYWHPRLPVPAFLIEAAKAGHRLIANWPPTARSFSIGLLTTMLPCHWLYTFAFTAAGTADPFAGALVMSFFWLGTLPALIAAGTSITRCAGRLGSIMPWVTATLMIATGVLTITVRVITPGHSHSPQSVMSSFISSYCNGTPER